MSYSLTEYVPSETASTSSVVETSYPGFSGVVSGYRLYSPMLERWLNRDPLGEEAFLRQFLIGKSSTQQRRFKRESIAPYYLFVRNTPILFYDTLGLASRMDDLQKLGNKCDPACELAELKKALVCAEWVRGRFAVGDIPKAGDVCPATGEKLTVKASGTCSPSDYSDTSKPGKWGWVSLDETRVEKCVGYCDYLHESVHKNMCENSAYSARNWELYGIDGSDTKEIELPAYDSTINCLKYWIKKGSPPLP